MGNGGDIRGFVERLKDITGTIREKIGRKS
jgi:hypothetical protein